MGEFYNPDKLYKGGSRNNSFCLLYTSDAADEL